MVSPSDDIDFLVCLPKQSHGIPRWWKIKDQSIKEMEFGSIKYSYSNENQIHKMKITNATIEDSAEYQFSSGNNRSNKIYVYVDGKYIFNFFFNGSFFVIHTKVGI